MNKVATGLAVGVVDADPSLAAEAVSKAMQTLNIEVASSVLLFLTSEFANDPLPALRIAAKTANCLQVMGCSAPGIFTEEDWVLDAPAAAAMVFSDNIYLQLPEMRTDDQLILSLTAPNAMNTSWMASPGLRFGGVSGDAIGQGPFSVWQNAKGAAAGYCEAIIHGVEAVVEPAHCAYLLSEPEQILEVDGHDIQALSKGGALQTLHQAYKENSVIPMHLMMAVYADSAEAIIQGKYHLATLVSGNETDGSVTLAKRLQPGQYLAWAIRDTDAAQVNLQRATSRMSKQLKDRPDFGMLFSCLGRGPYFYDGLDRDLMIMKAQYPRMPIIGFYGNGEIAPVNGSNELLEYSAVIGLFSESKSDGAI